MSAQKTINLLPPTQFELSYWGRFLKWAVTAGRYIIIITELIVIVAFLSRFKLDKDLGDINSTISGQLTFLNSLKAKEAEYIEVQNKLETVEGLVNKQLNAESWMGELLTSVPVDLRLTMVDLGKQEIALSGGTFSQSQLGSSLASLTRNKKFKVVDLTDVTADNAKGIKFSVKIVR